MMPIYVSNDNSISLTKDASVTAIEGATISATNYRAIVGSSFTIQIPTSTTAGTLTVQGNNSNPWTNNSFVGRDGSGTTNTSFSANWINVGTMTGNFLSVNLPVRWIRLSGSGVFGTNFIAHIWTSDGVHQ